MMPSGQKKRMVHYTSAENAFRIISSKELWLRNTNTMVDYSEVVHGHKMLRTFFGQKAQQNLFSEAMSLCHPGAGDEAIKQFDAWWDAIRYNTYIASISEHESSEDVFGRLSMWRGFSQNAQARAALVLNVPEWGAAEGLHVLLTPVSYYGYGEVERDLWEIIGNVKQNTDFLKSFDRQHFINILFFMLAGVAVSLKHLSFREEREWRVVYLPDRHPSSLIQSSIEVLGGIPQIVHKIPLQENPENELVGVGIPALLDRIIIGPSVYTIPMFAAFVRALKEAGVTDADKRVVFSEIPIRS